MFAKELRGRRITVNCVATQSGTVICGLVLFTERFDMQPIGYVAPALSNAWKLPPGALGPVFAAGLVGLSLGAFFAAPLGDRFGRKSVMVWSSIAFGALTVATG